MDNDGFIISKDGGERFALQQNGKRRKITVALLDRSNRDQMWEILGEQILSCPNDPCTSTNIENQSSVRILADSYAVVELAITFGRLSSLLGHPNCPIFGLIVRMAFRYSINVDCALVEYLEAIIDNYKE